MRAARPPHIRERKDMERSNRNLWIGLGILAVLLLVALPAMSGGMLFGRGFVGTGPFGPRPFIGPFMWGFWGIAALVRLLFFGLIVFLVVRLFRGRGFRGYRGYYDDEPHYSQLTPQEILRRRYAAGDITHDEYDEMRRNLEPTA